MDITGWVQDFKALENYLLISREGTKKVLFSSFMFGIDELGIVIQDSKGLAD